MVCASIHFPPYISHNNSYMQSGKRKVAELQSSPLAFRNDCRLETLARMWIHPVVTYAAVICKSRIITLVTVCEVGRFLKFAHINCSNLLYW